MTRNPFANDPNLLSSRRPIEQRRAWDESDAGRIKRALATDETALRTARLVIDLRKIRVGLGLKPQYVAALAGISDMTLLNCEEKQDDPQMVEQILAILALYMATRWGADILNLTEANLEGTN